MGFKTIAAYVLLICNVVASHDSLVNENVTTLIDISSQLVKIRNEIIVINNEQKPVNRYLYIVDQFMKTNLSFIQAQDTNGNLLDTNKVFEDEGSKFVQYEVVFYRPILPGDKKAFEIVTIFTNCLHSYPVRAKQNEKHFVLFTFNVYYFSLYLTETQTLSLYAGKVDVKTVNGEEYGMINNSNGLQYGPYYFQEPKATYFSRVHYESNSPFLTVTKLQRNIQISHWGYLNVLEKISLLNTGPKFVGPFERPLKNFPPDTRIESIIMSISEFAFDIYVKDDIGLISSFQVEYNYPNATFVHLKLRFLLYGGWKTQFEIGYSIPIKYHVVHDHKNNLYYLSIPLVNGLFQNMIIKEAEINIVLPEGGRFQNIYPHYEVENNTGKRFCYYLDSICREFISFKVHNLVNHHGYTQFKLAYSHSQMFLLLKPLGVAAFLYTIFLLLLMYMYLALNPTTKDVLRRSPSQMNYARSSISFMPKKKENSMKTKQVVGKDEVNRRKTLSKPKYKTRKY